MAFTTGNDINILQSSDTGVVSAGAGTDRYVLDASVLAANQAITISDTGSNTLQLTGGLLITSSLVSNDALQLTLSNGAVVTVLGASNFSFQTGGNAINGIGGTTQTYSAFVTSSLNVAAGVPAAGVAPATGGTVTVNPTGGTGPVAPVGPVFSVTASAASVTDGSSATYTVTLSAAQGTTSTVAYTLAGTGGATLGIDTTAQPTTGTLNFAPGVTTQTIVVAVTSDTLPEIGEGVSLTLSAPSTGTVLSTTAATVNVGLADPVAPTFTLTSNAIAGAATTEGNTITYTITPSSITDRAYTFTLTTQGDTIGGVAGLASGPDFSPAASTVTFAAFSTTAQTVVQTVVADGITEGLEGYKTTLLNSSLAAVSSISGLINDGSVAGTVGTTFILTTAIDNVVGTAADDVIIGDNATLSATDVINGGAGIDTLSYTNGSGGAAAIPAATITNVEVISERNVNTNIIPATDTISAAIFVGATTFNSVNSTAPIAFTNLAAATQTGGVVGNSVTINNASSFGFTSGAAATLNISGGTTAGLVSATGGTVTSTTVNSTGAANTLGGLTLSGVNTALTINAATNLTTGTISGFTGANATITVNGAAASVNLGTIDSAVKTINAAGLTAGSVTTTLNAQTTVNFTGGAGNDLVTAGGILAAGALVDAGAGTADRLTIVTTGQLTAVAASFYRNFEVLAVTDGVSADVSMLAANNTINSIRITDGAALGGTAVTNLNATQAANIAILAANPAGIITIDVKDAPLAGNIDTVKATLTNTNGTTGVAVDLTGISLTGVEKLELTGIGTTTATSGAVILTTTAAVSLDSIKLTTNGNANTIVIGNTQTATNLVLDASATTGSTTLDVTNYTTATGATVRGGTSFDVLLGSARADLINGGAGNDVISGDGTVVIGTPATATAIAVVTAVTFVHGAADVLTGGAGRDVFAFKAGAGNTVAVASTITDLELGGATLATGVDQIVVSTGTAGTAAVVTLTAAQQTTVTGAATLAAAVDSVLTFATAVNATATFTYGADTYLIVNGDGNTTVPYSAASDMLIKITGVTGTLDASDISIIV